MAVESFDQTQIGREDANEATFYRNSVGGVVVAVVKRMCRRPSITGRKHEGEGYHRE